jgi:hypothetical protein
MWPESSNTVITTLNNYLTNLFSLNPDMILGVDGHSTNVNKYVCVYLSNIFCVSNISININLIFTIYIDYFVRFKRVFRTCLVSQTGTGHDKERLDQRHSSL